jgi:hypothetical protein
MTASLSWVTVSVKMGSFLCSSRGYGAGRMVKLCVRCRKGWRNWFDVVEDDEEGPEAGR